MLSHNRILNFNLKKNQCKALVSKNWKIISRMIFFLFHYSILCLQFVITQLLQEDVDEVGDLYLDVAEAYMEQKCFTEAKPILERLVCSQNYNLVRQIIASFFRGEVKRQMTFK